MVYMTWQPLCPCSPTLSRHEYPHPHEREAPPNAEVIDVLEPGPEGLVLILLFTKSLQLA